MASLNNMGKDHLPITEKTDIKTALFQFEQLLNGKVTDLTPEERQKYGSINEQNKLIVQKVMDYHNDQPQHDAPEVDWAEFEADFESRRFWESIAARLHSLLRQVEGTKILHDYDNYQAALIDYRYTQYRASLGTAGSAEKETALKQFFARTSSSTSDNTEV